MNEETLEPPCKKYKMENLLSEQVEKTLGGSTNSTEDYFSQDIDVADADVRKSVCDDKYSNFVTPEELDKLREFQVLDEVKSNDEDSNDEDSDSSDGKSDKLPEDEIEKMLDEDLPDDFKGVPKPKEKSYITRQKIVLEEKGINHFEALPLDWMIVRHYSGMPVYMHRTTRVCTLSKPYFLGKGNTRRHDIPISAIPCLLYRKALIEEDKQMAIDKQIDEQIRSGTWQQTGDKTQKSEKNVEISYNFNDKENNETIVDKINNDQNNEMNDNINLDINYKIVKEVNCINNNEMTSKIDDDIEMSDVQVKKSKCRFSHLIIRQNSETKNDNEVYKTNAENIMIRYKSNEEQKQTQSEIENAIVNIEERACKTSFVETVNPTVDFNEKSPSEETKSNSDKAVTTIPDNEITEPNSEPSIEEGAYEKSIMDTVDQSEDINEKSPSEGTEANGDNTVTKETDNETKEPNIDPTIDEIPLSRQPVVLPGGIVMPPPRVENVSTSWKTQHLTHEQVNDYCKKLFKFKTVNIMHFKRWADRRKYTKARKTLQYPTLPEGTKLITIPAQAASGENGGTKAKRDWVMNMNGRSYLSVFHEYVRRALQKQPVYEFKQLENASTPYQATVFIGGMQYGVGHGSSKRSAKSAAARASIHILIPEMRAELSAAPTPHTAAGAEPDFSFFDYVGIEDPRITEFCAATCEPSPHAILRTCLLRNFGAGDRHIHTEMKKLEYQKMELTMKVGKHSATVVCKNKKTAKQRASQAILQALHPHVRSWGSLLRLYGSRSVKSCKEKKIEEQQITLLQDAARQNEPNYAVLEKLRNEMRKLMERDDAVVPIGTLVVKDDLPTHSGSNLNNVDL